MQGLRSAITATQQSMHKLMEAMARTPSDLQVFPPRLLPCLISKGPFQMSSRKAPSMQPLHSSSVDWVSSVFAAS